MPRVGGRTAEARRRGAAFVDPLASPQHHRPPLLSPGIAHVSFSGGGLFLPVRSPSDRRHLIENVTARAQTSGLVQVLVDGERWMVRALTEHTVSCGNCGRRPDSACYSVTDACASYCATCVFARDGQEAHP